MAEKWIDRSPVDDDKNNATMQDDGGPGPAPAHVPSIEATSDFVHSFPSSPGDRPSSPTNSDDEDQKPPARQDLDTHPFDILRDIDVPEVQLETGRASDQFPMSFGFSAASPPTHHYVYQQQRIYDHQVNVSPTYNFFHNSNLPATVPAPHEASPQAPPYASLHYHQHHHMAQQQHMVHMNYHTAAVAARPEPSHARAQEPPQYPTTSTGEHSSQFPRGPSQEELEEAKTSRARLALQTWYKRLEDLCRYRVKHGHCKLLYDCSALRTQRYSHMVITITT